MVQYAVLIFEGATDLPDEFVAQHVALPDRIAAAGGKVVAGLGLHAHDTATAIRDGLVTDAPFMESKEGLAGVYVLEARDLDHAIELASMTPIIQGGVEVRPLLGFQVVD